MHGNDASADGENPLQAPPVVVARPDAAGIGSPDKAAEAGLQLLRQLEMTQLQLDRVKAAMAKLNESPQMQLSKEIASAWRRPWRILALPYLTARIVHRARRRRAEQAALAEEGIEAMRPGPVAGHAQVFLRKDASWLRFDVQPDTNYRIHGTVNSFREHKTQGALLSVAFLDQAGKVLPFDDEVFAWQPASSRSICYLATGIDVGFSTVLLPPAGARVMHVGFSRFGEVPPINVTLAALEALGRDAPEPDTRGVESVGSRIFLGLGGIGDFDPDKPTVAYLLDEFSRDCFRPEFNGIELIKTEWKKQVEDRDVFAFFAESAWRGNRGQWSYAMTKPDKWGQELFAALDHFREAGIPTLFWNKEDPVNFDVFKDVARRFDHIFTTDSGRVAAYRELTGRDNAHTLMFAAQSRLHNPVRSLEPVDRIAFTGSWRGVKYPARAEWIDLLLTPVMERGILDIFDRYADEKGNPDLIFPDKFRAAQRGALPYAELVANVYKTYQGFVSVNSVEDSDTMMARRVFEMLGCGVPVISSPSPAIEKTFGDLVVMPTTRRGVEEAVDRIVGDVDYRERFTTRAVRAVHSRHTARHRFEEMAEIIGKPLIGRNRGKVSIICCSKRLKFLDQISRQIAGQTHAEREVIFVAHSPDFTDDAIAQAFQGENLKILRNAEGNVLADGLNMAMDAADGEFCAKFDDDDFYGPNYLADAMLGFGYGRGIGVVGKQSFFGYVQSMDRMVLRFPGKSYRMARRVHGGTLVWDRALTEGIRFERVVQGTDTLFIGACLANRVRILSGDPYNFIHIRYADLGNHTWKIADEEFVSTSRDVGQGFVVERAIV